MKVAFLSPTFLNYTGSDRVVENEAIDYVKAGHDVVVFTFRSNIKPKGYEIKELGMPKNQTLERIYRLFFFLDIIKIFRIIGMMKNFDLIVSFFYPMTIIATIAHKHYGIKYIYYNYGVAYADDFSNFLEKTYISFFKFLTNKTTKNADEAISISNFLRKELLKEIGLDSKVRYVKISDKEFNKHLDKNKINSIVKRYQLKKPILLYVGRLSPHKGVHLLIDAFKVVKKQYPNASLLIVGKDTFNGYVKRLKKNAPSGVVFTGVVSDEELPYFYGAADIYTTATLWEGYNMPIKQAQMCGKKVAAFDVGSHLEVVEKNKGKLVKKGDVQGLANAIIGILSKA